MKGVKSTGPSGGMSFLKGFSTMSANEAKKYFTGL